MSAVPDAAGFAALYRYPVKGLSAEPLPHATLRAPARPFPGDRSYAIENGPRRPRPGQRRVGIFQRHQVPDADARRRRVRRAPQPLRRRQPYPHRPDQRRGGGARADLGTAEGRAAVERFFAANLTPRNSRDRRRSRRATDTAFRTSQGRWSRSSTSVASPPSRQWSEQPVHPLRFRANLYVRGWPAWSELDLLERYARDRRDPAQGGQAHRSMHGHQRRPGESSSSRSRHSAHADANAGASAIAGSMRKSSAAARSAPATAIAAEQAEFGLGPPLNGRSLISCPGCSAAPQARLRASSTRYGACIVVRC